MLEPEQRELLDVFALAWEGSRGVEEEQIRSGFHRFHLGLEAIQVHSHPCSKDM